MNMQQKVMELIQEKGPVIPSDVHKSINQDLLTTSAILSELVEKKKLKVSHVKIGGSPLYFATGQEDKLQNFSHLLHKREQEVFQLLKEKKILEDSSLEPITRAALRNMKDFAVLISVNKNSEKKTYWKWYLETNENLEKALTSSQNKKESSNEKNIQQENQKKQPAKEKIAEKKDFQEQVFNFFKENEITVKDAEVIKKNEIDFLIEFQSRIGLLTFYCKAKSKKRSNDTDLNSAFTQGQFKKLPVIYLHNGELSKKAIELLKTQLKGVFVRKI